MTISSLLLLLFLAPPQDDKKKAADEADKAIEQFKKEHASPDLNTRIMAIQTLAKTQHDKILILLGDLLGKDDPTARIEAAKALGDYKEGKKKAVGFLGAAIDALKEPKDKEVDLIIACFDALGKLAEELGAGTANANIDRHDTKIAVAAVEATGKIRSASSIEPLINLLVKIEKEGQQPNNKQSGSGVAGGPKMPYAAKNDANKEARDRQKNLKPAVVKAIQSITKEKFTTGSDWTTWWNKHKATFKVEK